jgi:hypothetical protein
MLNGVRETVNSFGAAAKILGPILLTKMPFVNWSKAYDFGIYSFSAGVVKGQSVFLKNKF